MVCVVRLRGRSVKRLSESQRVPCGGEIVAGPMRNAQGILYAELDSQGTGILEMLAGHHGTLRPAGNFPIAREHPIPLFLLFLNITLADLRLSASWLKTCQTCGNPLPDVR